MNLRIKTSEKQITLKGVDGESETVASLCEKVGVAYSASLVRILKGYPPKALTDFKDESSLNSLGIRSGDALTINVAKEIKNNDDLHIKQLNNTGGVLLRQVVPSDNSCLFTSINYCISGKVDSDKSSTMRQVIVGVISADNVKYSNAILGRDDYKDWILKSESWGGAIEAQILAEYFGMVISIIDTVSGTMTHFGENLGAAQRMLLIYDGVHYDPLYLETFNDDGGVKTLYSLDNSDVLSQAKELALEAQKSRQFTDMNNFTLKCTVCQTHLKGQTDAQNHAKSTGHTSFGEV